MPPRKPAAAAAPETPATDAPTTTVGADATAVATREAGEEVASDVAIRPDKKSAIMSLEDIGNLMIEDAEDDLGFGADDVALPFWRVLQSNSPQVKRQNGKYVEGAEAGMFFNAATNKTYDGFRKGVLGIPVHFKRQATLWIPRVAEGDNKLSGGGFVREVPMQEAEALLKKCTKNAKKKDIVPAGYTAPDGTDNGGMELVIAALYYLVLFDKDEPDSFETVAFPLTSTQMKKARAWNATIKNSRLPSPAGRGTYRPAMYAFAYRFTTVPESNTSGDWMGVKITQETALIKHIDGKPVEQFPGAASLYMAAHELKELVGKGKVRERQDYDETGTGADGGEGGGGQDDGADLPF